MTTMWMLLLGACAWGAALIVLFALCRVSSEQDRAARRHQKYLDPESDVTITRFG